MSMEKLDELLKQAEALTSDEKIILARRLLEGADGIRTSSTERQHNSDSDQELDAHRRSQHMKWLKEHQIEYKGRYVALDGDRLIGHGVTYREAAEAARQTGARNPFIVHVPDPDKSYFGGW